ncbi:FG-GAP-like repeat-containing protein [Lysobacter sp. Hz 25]|uniref:FG-GAP-like repeat-containing protein n=1 Tax=Lysobacter sp. Hz 25 TaxID=3383698 RepID=UPI0038D4C287
MFSSVSHGAIITSIAGGGSGGHYATRQTLVLPRAIAITPAGDIYLAEQARIRKIRSDGVASVIAGTGTQGYSGDGQAASAALVNQPGAVVADAFGNVYIADSYNHRIRKIGSDGIIRTIAGTGVAGPASDGLATASTLNRPGGLAIGPDGLLYIADTLNHRIRRLNADGTLVAVAGDGNDAFVGEGVPALQASLSQPNGLTFDAGGALLVADTGNGRVRKIAGGIITTVAGGGTDETDSGALTTLLVTPYAVAADANGNLFVMENYARRVRKISNGTATRVAGRSYVDGGSGDGGEATEASLGRPYGLATDSEGNLYIADTMNNRVRKVAFAGGGLPRATGSSFVASTVVPGPNPGNARAIEVGDVTGDGRDDIVVATRLSGDAAYAGKVLVYASQASGGYAAPIVTSYSHLDYTEVSDLVLADLNKDGIKDMILGDSGGVTVFRGSRDGVFDGRRYWVDSGVMGASLAIIDANLDGNADVAHQLLPSGSAQALDIVIFLGAGDGRLTSTMSVDTSTPGATRIVAGDVNGDGYKDLLSVDASRRAYLYEHDGANGFRLERMIDSDSGTADVGDFNNDGRPDLVSLRSNLQYSTVVLRHAGSEQLESIPGPGLAYKPLVADLNGDRRDDFLVARTGQLVLYQQTEFGLSEEQAYAAPNIADIAVGDVDGDGCKDAVALSSTQGILVFQGQGCTRGTPGDVDGNGKSDLLWRDDARQHVAIWKMDGAVRVEGIGHAVPPDWRVLATGDFQGDRKLDLVWTNGAQMQLWEGLGNGQFRGVPMADYPAGWRVVAVGDVNGDGNADLLWRNDANTAAGLWAMKGAQVIDSASYATSPDWWVAGSGDLSGDGRLDVIWTDGRQMQLWRADAALRFAGAAMPGYPQDWELTASGDVTGDGMADLMWRHPATGSFAVWAMAGGQRVFGMGYQPGPDWRVAQTGDFTGDGRIDIVWSNGSLMNLWQSQGNGFTQTPMPDYPLGWSVIRR